MAIDMFSSKELTVACIVAHPDDEVLLAGASLARHAAAGHHVHILILAKGLDARGTADHAAHESLYGQANKAAKHLGLESPPCFADFPDNAMDSVPLIKVVQAVESFLEKVAPQIIYTHHCGDLNIDHRQTHDAVATACRPTPGSQVFRILAGEVLSSTEWQSPGMVAFQPTIFHNVVDVLEMKISAMGAYAEELRNPPHPRSFDGIRTLARYRGLQSGYDSAEAFMLVRERA